MGWKSEKEKWVVACVFKGGGDFTEDHVQSLKAQVKRHFQADHDFVCVTDQYVGLCRKEYLWYDWEGWWSKLNLFLMNDRDRYNGRPVFYLDLDTVITDDFLPQMPETNEFWMIRDFCAWGNPRYESRWWASGLMAWKGDFSFIAKSARMQGIKEVMRLYLWDQIWINHCLRLGVEEGKYVRKAIEDVLRVKSYKVHGLQERLPDPPDRPQIVCFHGKPRPWEVNTPWVVEARG